MKLLIKNLCPIFVLFLLSLIAIHYASLLRAKEGLAVENEPGLHRDFGIGLEKGSGLEGIDLREILGGEDLTFNREMRENQDVLLLEGSSLFPVGVIDSGLEYTHDDLKAYLYRFSETPPITLFNNLVIENDFYGYDFANGDLLPYDDHSIVEISPFEEFDFQGGDFWMPLLRNGVRYLLKVLEQGAPGHGTHVSGIVIEMCDQNCSIVPLKVFSKKREGQLDQIIQAVEYARLRGIKVVNMSLCITKASAGPLYKESSKLFFEKLDILKQKMAEASETLFIVAAGNNSENLSESDGFFYPAQFDIENMIVVGAVNEEGLLAEFSNFDLLEVDIYAPGVEINSTFPYNSYMEHSGTSMAAPYVAGVVANYWSQNPDLSVGEIKSEILSRTPVRQLRDSSGTDIQNFRVPIVLRDDL